jgi:hypothetical protein
LSSNCAICSASTELLGAVTVLGKHEARYVVCPACGFVAVENPHWLEEAYLTPIADIDIGSVARAYSYSKVVKAVIELGGFDRTATFLDYGAGFGLLVRHMRDLGYDFRSFDQHCDSVFARGFECDIEKTERFELVTAFEVFEHLANPTATIERLADLSSTIVFSTELVSRPAPAVDKWWYYLPSTGQHISFFSQRSLEIIARRLNMRFFSAGTELHMLSSRRIPASLFRLLVRPRIAGLVDLVRRRPTLLFRDHERVMREAGLQQKAETDGRDG